MNSARNTREQSQTLCRQMYRSREDWLTLQGKKKIKARIGLTFSLQKTNQDLPCALMALMLQFNSNGRNSTAIGKPLSAPYGFSHEWWDQRSTGRTSSAQKRPRKTLSDGSTQRLCCYIKRQLQSPKCQRYIPMSSLRGTNMYNSHHPWAS